MRSWSCEYLYFCSHACYIGHIFDLLYGIRLAYIPCLRKQSHQHKWAGFSDRCVVVQFHQSDLRCVALVVHHVSHARNLSICTKKWPLPCIRKKGPSSKCFTWDYAMDASICARSSGTTFARKHALRSRKQCVRRSIIDDAGVRSYASCRTHVYSMSLGPQHGHGRILMAFFS